MLEIQRDSSNWIISPAGKRIEIRGEPVANMESRAQLVQSLTSASLSDAMGRLCNHKTGVIDLRTPTPGKILFGLAATIRFVPFRQDIADGAAYSFARFFYEAVGSDPADKVLVLDSSSHVDTSLGGGTKFSRLQNHGLAGLITDGRLRDFKELSAYDPVFYCSGETMRAGTGDLMPIAANVPVNLGGTTVMPGDYVFADGGGAVVIPARLLESALQMARDIEAADADFVTSIRAEDPVKIRKVGSTET